MATLLPEYRVTLYAPSNVDPDEVTVLTPAAGAPHSDPFQVSTCPVPGDDDGAWKPYLLPTHGGRRGRLDPVDLKCDIGSFDIELGDVTLADDDAERWASAFIGDDQARDQLLGIRAQREVSWDGGVTWANDAGGRVDTVASSGRLGVRISVRDETDRLERDVFVGRPPASVTNAWQQPLLPLGRLFVLPVQPHSGKGPASTLPVDGHYQKMRFHRGDTLWWELRDRTSDDRDHWVITRALVDLADGDLDAVAFRYLTFPAGALYLELQSAGGVTLGRMWVRRLTGQDYRGQHTVSAIEVEPLDPEDPAYLAPPVTNTEYYGALYPSGDPTADAPLVIGKGGEVNLITVAGQLLDGEFGRRDAAGNPIDVVRYDTASRDALAASLEPMGRLIVTKRATLGDVLVDQILRPLQLALVPDETGVLHFLSLQRPTAVLEGLLTISDTDLVGAADAERWSVEDRDRTNLITVHTWSNQGWFAVGDLIDQADGQTLDPPILLTGFAEQPPILVSALGDARAAAAKSKVRDIDYRAFVASVGRMWGLRAATDNLARFALGPRYVTYRLRRGTAHDALAVGDRRALGTSGVPDPTTHRRGLARVGLCIDVDPGLLDLTAVFLDEGLNERALVPDLGDLSLADGTLVPTIVDPYHVAILNAPDANAAGDPVEIQIAITAPGDSEPAADSPLWTHYNLIRGAAGLIMAFIWDLPQGQRLWVRGRSEPAPGTGALLPSDWVAPTPASIVLDALSAPADLVVSAIGATGAHLSWTPGDLTLPVRIYVEGQLWDTAPAGSSDYDLSGLAPDTAYDVEVRGVDAQGSETAGATASFTTLDDGAGLPRPAGLQVVVPSAITLRLFWADVNIPGTLERAPDDGGAPDLANIVTIADGLPGGIPSFTDTQPIDGAVWWYRFAQGANGVVGPWTEWVSASAQSGGSDTPAPVLPTVEPVTSEAGGIGTLDLTVTDPQQRVTAVEFRARQGTGSWTAWTADALPYSASVAVADGETSQIEARVIGFDALNRPAQVLWTGAFTFGAAAIPAEATILTSGDETDSLPNSRQLRDGYGTSVNTSVAGEVAIDLPVGDPGQILGYDPVTGDPVALDPSDLDASVPAWVLDDPRTPPETPNTRDDDFSTDRTEAQIVSDGKWALRNAGDTNSIPTSVRRGALRMELDPDSELHGVEQADTQATLEGASGGQLILRAHVRWQAGLAVGFYLVDSTGAGLFFCWFGFSVTSDTGLLRRSIFEVFPFAGSPPVVTGNGKLFGTDNPSTRPDDWNGPLTDHIWLRLRFPTTDHVLFDWSPDGDLEDPGGDSDMWHPITDVADISGDMGAITAWGLAGIAFGGAASMPIAFDQVKAVLT